MRYEILKSRIMKVFETLGPGKSLRAIGIFEHVRKDGNKPYQQNTMRVALYDLVREGKLVHVPTKKGTPNLRWYTLPEAKKNEAVEVAVEVAVEAARTDNEVRPESHLS